MFDFICRHESLRNQFRQKVDHRNSIKAAVEAQATVENNRLTGDLLDLARNFVALQRLNARIESFSTEP